MPASRSVVSVLLRELGDFSSHPQGRPCGRPHPAAVLGRQDRRRGGNSILVQSRHSIPSWRNGQPHPARPDRTGRLDCMEDQWQR
jgi:hypothetical protein